MTSHSGDYSLGFRSLGFKPIALAGDAVVFQRCLGECLAQLALVVPSFHIFKRRGERGAASRL